MKMTFPEELEIMMHNDKRNALSVGMAFKSMVKKAQLERRVTCGVFECAQLLNTNPDDVTLCILPVERNEDVTVHIQHTLIEAFCWENDIMIVKVDSTEKLGNIFANVNNNNVADDYNCVLITCAKDSQSTIPEHNLNDMIHVSDQYIIEIPVD